MSKKEEKIIEIPAAIGVRELAEGMGASPIDVIKILMTNGVMASINQQIDFDSAAIVAADMGFEAVLEKEDVLEVEEEGNIPLWRQAIANEDDKNLEDRPPVVTILGHVDHGKTTLLDVIRDAEVQAGEAGGITQHIGAYQTSLKGKMITFLDTPGHAAFTAMRARGAQGADIVVLVVAADDGVMPQTKEAIAHAKAARVPIIVALNKTDKANANPELVKTQLAENDLIPDDWDGDTMVIPLSALQNEGVEDLLEAILLVADNLDIKANPAGDIVGTVIEAEVDKKRGVMATLLVQNGTLKQSDIVVAGGAYGRLRAMFDYKGNRVEEAPPSMPVSVMGMNDVPSAGQVFGIVAADKQARYQVKEYLEAEKNAASSKKSLSLEDLFASYQAGETKELSLIIKADVQGSLDPIEGEMEKLGEGEIGINILYAETGNIGENDITLAAASGAIVIGFNVQAEVTARRLADREGVSIRLYNIIYRIVEDVEKALKGMLEPVFAEKTIGKAEVLAVFPISKVGKIAGCRVRDGIIRRNAQMRLTRGDDILFEGEVSSLKHNKDKVNEVRNGFECGIGLQNFHDIEEGDILQCYILEKEEIE
ncbi:MAG: translation initiation factor IF-2 [Anaerolineae bacterium]|jgi:translation initiation factor IF-2|nr:translation initiation factor IF-2 [Anaerolineae bacterium]MBT4312044.1 translation initiation factor IF-2 [Anaerolineae bacterium]MBT4459500.1 translation initiation factor IF-2 [Anaerolineae bacterium]MBT4842108.1 translation initiation factor IF-2 [Anaerolineae bacterium]MBT6062258.1 translation initiation factor IF-2 [Anaerolineae bacterium]